jgi:hypothetical protein
MVAGFPSSDEPGEASLAGQGIAWLLLRHVRGHVADLHT